MALTHTNIFIFSTSLNGVVYLQGMDIRNRVMTHVTLCVYLYTVSKIVLIQDLVSLCQFDSYVDRRDIEWSLTNVHTLGLMAG